MTFNDLNLIPDILKALSKENYSSPTPIQEQAIPAVLEGRDIFGCAQTGTGKTAAFSLPIIQLLSAQKPQSSRRRIRSLILSPTRELALQISENIDAYSQFTDLRSFAIVGGVSQRSQERALERGTDILIATPGRLMDLMNQRLVDLQHVQILVLDEADRMLDMGFINDVKKLFRRCRASAKRCFSLQQCRRKLLTLLSRFLQIRLRWRLLQYPLPLNVSSSRCIWLIKITSLSY